MELAGVSLLLLQVDEAVRSRNGDGAEVRRLNLWWHVQGLWLCFKQSPGVCSACVYRGLTGVHIWRCRVEGESPRLNKKMKAANMFHYKLTEGQMLCKNSPNECLKLPGRRSFVSCQC